MSVADRKGAAMIPSFELLMASGVTFATVVLACFIWLFDKEWRVFSCGDW
jgi:hypothetical protein